MKEEKLKVIQFIREFIIKLEKELNNFPKKDIEVKNKIRNNTYDLLEISYEANSSSSMERKRELLEEALAKIKVIDFLLNLSYDNELLPGKRYIKLGQKLDDITKYMSGWLKKISGQIGA